MLKVDNGLVTVPPDHNPNRTLIIVAHQDDEALSCGVFIPERVSRGRLVRVVTIFGRVYDYGKITEGDSFAEQYDFFLQSQSILGFHEHLCYNLPEGEPNRHSYYALLEIIEAELKSFQPTEVIIPSAHDLNQDHRLLNEVCRIALRPGEQSKGIVRIMECLAFDSTKTHPNFFIQHDEVSMDKKLEAVAAYKTEIKGFRHPRNVAKIRAQHAVWGGLCYSNLAEAFNLIYHRI